MAHSVYKFESRLNAVISGPPVFEIWRTLSGPQDTSILK